MSPVKFWNHSHWGKEGLSYCLVCIPAWFLFSVFHNFAENIFFFPKPQTYRWALALDAGHVQQLKVKNKGNFSANFFKGFVLINAWLENVNKTIAVTLSSSSLSPSMLNWPAPRYLVPDSDFFENDWQETWYRSLWVIKHTDQNKNALLQWLMIDTTVNLPD